MGCVPILKKTKKPLIFVIIFFLMLSCDRYVNGIKTGKEFLTKEVFLKSNISGRIRTIQVGKFDESHSREIVILGDNDMVVFDSETRTIITQRHLKQSIAAGPELLGMKDNGMRIMIRGGGFADVGVVNESGDFIWKWDREAGTSPQIRVGDLDQDGKLEFYVADVTGLHRLDCQGKEVWKSSGQKWEEEIAIYNPEGVQNNFILTRGSDGTLRFRDSAGQLIKEIKPQESIFDISIVRWPDDDYHILSKKDYEVFLLDFEGKITFRYKFKPDIFPFYVHLLEIMEIKGIPVKLNAKRPPYLAVLTRFRTLIGSSMLSVFSPEGNLVYQEMLSNTGGINKILSPGGNESLLVGDTGGIVWKYYLVK
jgi:hypothetical protein